MARKVKSALSRERLLRQTTSPVARLVLSHPHGDVPAVGALNTPRKRAAWERQFDESTRESYEEDRRSRQDSLLDARNTMVGGAQ